jgi:molybdenum cofactor cytidylyltransferase
VLLMRLAAMVLAAGRSRRFGTDNKLLAVLDGQPLVARTVAAATAAGFDRVVVVTGPDHLAIAATLADCPVRLIRCADARDGLGFSIATGIGALAAEIDGVAILPGDMPLMTPATLKAMADIFVAHGGERIVHAIDAAGEQRNPVFWPRAFFPMLASLEGDRGAKTLIRESIGVRPQSDDELVDVDEAAALATAQEILRTRSGTI